MPENNTAKTGVYPVYENQFKIDVTGGDGSTADNLKTIADMESFSVSVDGNVEEWRPFEAEGWVAGSLQVRASQSASRAREMLAMTAMTISRDLPSKQGRRRPQLSSGRSRAGRC